jgi:hypothetical protein
MRLTGKETAAQIFPIVVRLEIINTSSRFCRALERKKSKNFQKEYATHNLPRHLRGFFEVANAGS